MVAANSSPPDRCRARAEYCLPQAVSYFKLSADLGDADAQSDLAFCYANGKGCKKDMKAAAKVSSFSPPRFRFDN